MKQLSTLLALFITLFVFTSNATAGNDWQVLKEQDGIVIKYKYSDCNPDYGFDQESIILQVTNTNTVSKTLSWDLQLWYNGVCKTCADSHGEYSYTLALAPGETLEGGCNNSDDYRLSIFSKFIDANYTNPNPDELTKYELANFTISN